MSTSFGLNSWQGVPSRQEDRYLTHPHFEPDSHMFAVFDGHNGEECSEFASSCMVSL